MEPGGTDPINETQAESGRLYREAVSVPLNVPTVKERADAAKLRFVLHVAFCPDCVSYMAPFERRAELDRLKRREELLREYRRTGLRPTQPQPFCGWDCAEGVTLAQAAEAVCAGE